MDPFTVRLRDTLQGRCRIPPDAAVLLAVSGGADSVAMFHAMATLRRPPFARLEVGHVDHGLRGPDSAADSEFVERLAERLGVRFRVRHLRMRQDKDGCGEGLETRARRRRHAALAEMAREAGCGYIALAHHADDQVELFLLRLLRGAGSTGLGGMRWVSPSPADPGLRLVRPMLDLGRDRVREYLDRVRQPHREDASNLDTAIPRNAIRRVLLPWLRDFTGAGVDGILQRTAEVLGAEAEFLEECLARWRQQGAPGGLETLPVALQRLAIRDDLIDQGVAPTFELIERLRRRPGCAQSASGTIRIAFGPDGLRIAQHEPAPQELAPVTGLQGGRGSRVLPDGTRVAWRTISWTGGRPSSRPGVERFDADAVGAAWTLRRWIAGDRFQPLGMRQAASLQNQFVNRKIGRDLRHRLWMACTDSGEIFWVEGLPPGERFKVRSGTRRVLEWRWSREGL